MADEKIVNYLFIKMKVSNYKKLAAVCVIFLAAAAILSYIYLRGQSAWILKNLWWICILGVIGEIIEIFIALKKAVKPLEKS